MSCQLPNTRRYCIRNDFLVNIRLEMQVISESIYNLIPKPVPEASNKPLYRSRYDPKAPLTGSTFGLHGTTVTVGQGVHELKKTCVISSTFGPPHTSCNQPCSYLRKGSRTVPKLNSSCPFQRTIASQKPSVPSRDEAPVMGLVTCKNFINANAAEAIIMTPPTPKAPGMNYLKKNNYGQVPEYLTSIKSILSREKALIDELVQTKTREKSTDPSEYELMDEEERQQLIDRLKMKWDTVNSKYQKICHRVTIDSLGDIRRKETQERELQQLEEDIEMLSRPGPLLVKKV